MCKPCKRVYDREWCKNRSAKQKEHKRKGQKDRRREKRQAIIDYWKRNPCISCGETSIAALQFDHRDSEIKIANVSDMVKTGYGLEAIIDEIAKCDVLCANCHAVKTAEQLGWYKDLDISPLGGEMDGIYIGIDPGKSGGIAVIENGEIRDSIAMPLRDVDGKSEVDIRALLGFLSQYGKAKVVIEKVHGRHGWAANSNFNFGMAYQACLCVAEYLGCETLRVTPQKWQKEVFESTGDTKQKSFSKCLELWPKQKDMLRDRTKKKTSRSKLYHDGITDALCIAHYGALVLS